MESSKAGVAEAKESRDVAIVRAGMANLVKDAGEDIARGMIEVAKTGQLATAKYLLELAGVYPATAEPAAREESLAESLLRRVGLPTEPRAACTEGRGLAGKTAAGRANDVDEESGKGELRTQSEGKPKNPGDTIE